MTLSFPTDPDSRSKREPETDARFEAFWQDAVVSMPREQAGDDFTDRVLRRVDESRSRSNWRPLVAAMVLVATGLGSYSFADWRRQLDATERVAVLRAEYEVLRDELAALEAAQRRQGLVYLGGENDVELVLDVGRLARNSRRGPAAAAPAGGSAAPAEDSTAAPQVF